MVTSASERDRCSVQVEDVARSRSPYIASSGQCAASAGGTATAADSMGSARLRGAVPAVPQVLDAVAIISPDTVIRWHRRGFKAFWRWKSRSRGGRPAIPKEIRDLIREMSQANWLWGAPRIHGELLKLGIGVAESTVAKSWSNTPDDRVRVGRPSCATMQRESPPRTCSSCRRSASNCSIEESRRRAGVIFLPRMPAKSGPATSLLRPDDLLSDSLCLFRHSSRQSRSRACPNHASPDKRVAGQQIV
jgi:hypothetical protein